MSEYKKYKVVFADKGLNYMLGDIYHAASRHELEAELIKKAKGQLWTDASMKPIEYTIEEIN